MTTHSTPTPTFATIAGWRAISGMSRTSTYRALGRRDLAAVKVGRRTLIDVASGLAWIARQPAPAIRAA